VRDPDARISALPLLSEAEERQAIAGWNRTLSYPRAGCLHQRFERQAALTPDAVAIVCEERQLTYAQLNRRANDLARRLRSLGVGPDRLIALRTERSMEMIVGILGILKAGCAYLPLDPAYPKERVAFMLRDSHASVLVTQRSAAAGFEDIAGTAVFLDEAAPGVDDDPPALSTADSPAYVIYTSGSTGEPKGVVVSHYNVTRLFDATAAWYRFDSRDVWTLFHSCAFDFSVWELWGALLHGGRLVIVPYAVSRAPDAFRELLVRERVTVLNQTPSAFRQLLQADAAQPKAELALRYVVFGGEALELESLRPWFERYGDARPLLVNMYGITETTVHVTYRPIRARDLNAGQGSVIGSPIPDLQVYILDKHGRPAPIGVPGEICVGGAGVARGYLNRPELTAQRFIPDRFGPDPQARLYRSGDLARRLANGDIQYLGRIDQQLKIRGFRIEPGEVEAAIGRHRAVREVAVVAREDIPGDKRLVAYVVADAGAVDLAAELRAFARETLPQYMVPAHFVRLASLPLTGNGKLDRGALPPPSSSEMAPCAGALAPRTTSEEIAMRAFCESLARQDFGVLDNFFDLGGDSLMAARLMHRLRTLSGLELRMRDLFERPTVAALAEAIDSLSWLDKARAPAAGAEGRQEVSF
jgi:amino acid adenylation domain-containing protein